MNTVAGIPLIEQSLLTVEGLAYRRRRSWRRRLFSRPWRPWVSTEVVTPQVPDPKIYVSGQGSEARIFAHPETARRLLDALEAAPHG